MKKKYWKSKSSSGYTIGLGSVSVWKLHWFGGTIKLYINLVVMSLMLNDIIDHIYRKIYMIVNVSRLSIKGSNISISPQMVGDIDMVWLLRAFARNTSEFVVWWFFDDILSFLLKKRYFILGSSFGLRYSYKDSTYSTCTKCVYKYDINYLDNLYCRSIIHKCNINYKSLLIRPGFRRFYTTGIINNYFKFNNTYFKTFGLSIKVCNRRTGSGFRKLKVIDLMLTRFLILHDCLPVYMSSNDYSVIIGRHYSNSYSHISDLNIFIKWHEFLFNMCGGIFPAYMRKTSDYLTLDGDLLDLNNSGDISNQVIKLYSYYENYKISCKELKNYCGLELNGLNTNESIFYRMISSLFFRDEYRFIPEKFKKYECNSLFLKEISQYYNFFIKVIPLYLFNLFLSNSFLIPDISNYIFTYNENRSKNIDSSINFSWLFKFILKNEEQCPSWYSSYNGSPALDKLIRSELYRGLYCSVNNAGSPVASGSVNSCVFFMEALEYILTQGIYALFRYHKECLTSFIILFDIFEYIRGIDDSFYLDMIRGKISSASLIIKAKSFINNYNKLHCPTYECYTVEKISRLTITNCILNFSYIFLPDQGAISLGIYTDTQVIYSLYLVFLLNDKNLSQLFIDNKKNLFMLNLDIHLDHFYEFYYTAITTIYGDVLGAK